MSLSHCIIKYENDVSRWINYFMMDIYKKWRSTALIESLSFSFSFSCWSFHRPRDWDAFLWFSLIFLRWVSLRCTFFCYHEHLEGESLNIRSIITHVTVVCSESDWVIIAWGIKMRPEARLFMMWHDVPVEMGAAS